MTRPIAKKLIEAMADINKWPKCQNKKCNKPISYEGGGHKSYDRWMKRKYCSPECQYEARRLTIETEDIRKWPVCQNRDCGKPIPFNREKHGRVCNWRKRKYCDNACHVNELSYRNYIEAKECEKCGATIEREEAEHIKQFRLHKRCKKCQTQHELAQRTKKKDYNYATDKALAATSKPIIPGFVVFLHRRNYGDDCETEARRKKTTVTHADVAMMDARNNCVNRVIDLNESELYWGLWAPDVRDNRLKVKKK